MKIPSLALSSKRELVIYLFLAVKNEWDNHPLGPAVVSVLQVGIAIHTMVARPRSTVFSLQGIQTRQKQYNLETFILPI